ncbi:hypothetical protein GGI17_000379 [Coemansia sp. S146]|nr:hypothetical protein GGI17_000379 [Coemansia sp. S146]
MGLSEQKERMIFSADPRNTTWSSDKGRFGFKMLEKMGWSEGKGLGANEDGMKEHVKIKLKTNNFGIGADKKNIRNWLENADGFSELLSRLNSDANTPSENNDDGDDDDKKKKRKKDEKKKLKKEAKEAKQKSDSDTVVDTAESTETVLNAASVRLNRLSHRTRFRNMKKMALQDEKGLQEIFGVRSAPSTFVNTPDTKESESPSETPPTLTTQTTQIIETGVSVSDYFAQKVAANPALAAIYGVVPAKPAVLDSESSAEDDESEMPASKKRKAESSDSKEDRKKAKEEKKQAKENKKRAKEDKKKTKADKRDAKREKKDEKSKSLST